MKTRKDYLDGKCTHSEYYCQFVTPKVKARVQRIFGKRLLESKDASFNDIPLKEWDAIPCPPIPNMKPFGDYLTLSGKVCIFKEAARQIREGK